MLLSILLVSFSANWFSLLNNQIKKAITLKTGFYIYSVMMTGSNREIFHVDTKYAINRTIYEYSYAIKCSLKFYINYVHHKKIWI